MSGNARILGLVVLSILVAGAAAMVGGALDHGLRDASDGGLLLAAPVAPDLAPGAKGELSPSDRARMEQRFGNLPLYFVENQGQLDEQVRYYMKGRDKTLYFTADGVTISLEGEESRWSVKLDFVGANPGANPRGEERQQAIFSYFKGNDPTKWRAGCATYARIVYEDLWPGIDLVFRGAGNKLKHEFLVEPGADPGRIRFAFRGASDVRLDDGCDLVVETPLASLEDARPVAYQERDGRRVEVEAAFDLDPARSPQEAGYGFALGGFDPSLPLVLDPEMIVYSGFLGGSSDEWGHSIAVDAWGAAYVAGYTYSSDFPTVGGPDPSFNGDLDAFVAKVDPAGSALVYSGFLGGSGLDYGMGIAVDPSGAASLIGWTESTDFPTTGGPDPTFNGGLRDAFVTKVDPTGSALVYSGFLGGSQDDEGYGIAVDGSGAAYVTGRTFSTDYPTVGGPDPTFNGVRDTFITKVEAGGSALVYSGFLGGSGDDNGYGIAVDPSGAAYVTGRTASSDFPAIGGLDPTFNGVLDAFVAKVDPAGSGFVYSGFLGGSDWDEGYGIAVDAVGAAYVTGRTPSTDFPTVGGLDPTYNGGSVDAFVAKVEPAGGALAYSGFLGGADGDVGLGIAVDGSGAAYVTGQTDSTDFPTVGGLDPTYNGGWDAFVAKVDPTGNALSYSGFLGGSGDDLGGTDIAVDASGAAYVTGTTRSYDFPGVGSLDPSYNGGWDAFVTKVDTVPLEVYCRQGAVNMGVASVPSAVVTINGQVGDAERIVDVAVGEPIELAMDVPPAGPDPAPFALYTWVGEPDATTVTPQPAGLGDMCFATPLSGGAPQPKKIWNNIGRFGDLGQPDFPSTPAPSVVFSKPSGLSHAATFTFQGFILDDGSAGSKPASITNAVILKVMDWPAGMVPIPAGEFLMGCHSETGESCDPDALPVHAVYLSAFYLDVYEVTNQQYADGLNWAWSEGGLIQVTGGVVYKYGDKSIPYCDTTGSSSESLITWDGSTFGVVAGKEDHPMVMVSWYGSAAYSNWRSGMEGRTPSYDTTTWECNFEGNGYRLPTEAEWEYAARGGEQNPYYTYPWGNTIDGSKANYWGSGDPYETGPSPWTTPVGYYDGNQTPPGTDMANGYGLYDMAGNAWEWCNDWYSFTYYGSSPYDNPRGPASGIGRVLRGGSWVNIGYTLRCAMRYWYYPWSRLSSNGFRVALD